MKIGALFDWDGVIIDSSRFHEESWEQLARQENKTLPPGYFQNTLGKKNETIIPDILTWTHEEQEIKRIAARKEEIYRRLIIDRGIAPLPGVQPFLTLLREHHIPCGIGSSTPRLNILTALDQLGLGTHFDVIIAAEDVSKGKPDPQVFLLAAQTLQEAPQQCVVFEDAVAGIQAAKAGSMKAVAVTTSNPAPRLREADMVVNRLDELSIAHLEELFSRPS